MGRKRTIGNFKKKVDELTGKRELKVINPNFSLNKNISNFKGWQDWQNRSTILQVHVLKGKYIGITLDVFEHYNDNRYYCISDSFLHEGAAIEIISKDYCEVI